ncbi:YiiX family permuted papain-like enzyme [Fusobacterium sp. PH5-44]|uniref:YiiX family permuted papain-like enzyme n=1 Tax=unclassified Fusobacterium TaxID=2648384 RepID=UPI003D1AD5B2
MYRRLKSVFLIVFIISFSLVAGNMDKYELKDGDIIFHISLSRQSKAIQLATDSKYSHCGIIYKKNNKYYVLEAVQPVKLTKIEEWIARGKDKHFVIKRLKNRDKILTSQRLQKMQSIGEKFIGKNYDLTFEWSDKNIYCSELIWKIYKRGANVEIGKLEKLKDFDLSHKIVKEKLEERYGDRIPVNETVISPKSIFESDLLYIVTEY